MIEVREIEGNSSSALPFSLAISRDELESRYCNGVASEMRAPGIKIPRGRKHTRYPKLCYVELILETQK